MQVVQGRVHRFHVAAHHLRPTAAPGFANGFLDVGNSLIPGQDIRQGEEAGLHDRVDPSFQTRFFRHFGGIDHKQPGLSLNQRPLDLLRQPIPDLLFRPGHIEQHRCTLGGVLQHIKTLQELGCMNGHELGPVDLVTGADRQRAEPQVGYRGGAGFFGVVDEMALGKQVRAFAQNLDTGLVTADSAIGTQTEEQRPAGFRGLNVQFAVHVQREMTDIVPHANGKTGFRGFGFQLVENSADHGRGKFPGRQTIAPPDHPGQHLAIAPAVSFHQGATDFQQQGLTLGSGFLGTVQDCQVLDGIRQSAQETVGGKGPEQSHLEDPDLPTLLRQPLHRLMGAFGPGTHQDDHPVGLGVAEIIKQPVLAPGNAGKPVHHGFKFVRKRLIERVDGLPGLEEGVRVLGGAPNHWPVRRHPAATMRFHPFVRYQRLQILITERCNLGNFMGGPEPIEEMHHRHPAFQGHGMADCGHILSFLNRSRRQQGKTGTAGTHHIRMVAENGQSMGGNAAGGNVHAERRQLAGNLVQIGQHQQQPLGGGKGGHQGTGLQRPVHGTGRAGLGLHLHHTGHLPPEIGFAQSRPVIGVFAHHRGGGNRIDGNGFAQAVSHRGHRFIAVEGMKLHGHNSLW